MGAKQYYDNEFLDINEHAKELVEKLASLHREMEKHKDAKEELSELSKRLLIFIKETEELSKKSSKIIENISKIDLVKIDAQISEFNNSLTTLGVDLHSKIDEKISSMDNLSKRTLKNIEEHTKIATSKIDEHLSEIKESYLHSEEHLSSSIEKGIKKIIDTNSKTNAINVDEQISELKSDVKKLELAFVKTNKKIDELQTHLNSQFEGIIENIKNKSLWSFGKK